MKLKEYMEAKKLMEQRQKVLEIKIQKKGTGKKYGNSRRKSKNRNNDSQRD